LSSLLTIVKQYAIRPALVLVLLFACNRSLAQYTKLLDFTGGTEAKAPSGSLITDGIYMYGVTTAGGSANMGTVYRTNQNGTGYVKLLDFTGVNGNFPEGSLYYDGSFLYGMTYLGGVNDKGVIYKIKPDGTNYQKLFDFDGTNGEGPYGVFVSDGTYLYAMTWKGGANNLGRIFRILPDGTGYQNLLDFAGATNGSYPASSLYYDSDLGSLYGMTSQGGASGFGTVFKINPDGSGYDDLYDFIGGTDGREPYGAVISDGTYLYGLTYFGGTSNNGTVFRIEPDGTNYTKLHDLTGGLSGGSHPYTTLALAGSHVYGLTSDGGQTDGGIMFKIETDGTGFTKLLTFFGASNGRDPSSTLTAVGPFLYGTTTAGGASGNGTMFKYEVTEAFTKLLDFTGTVNGLDPSGSLYSDGTFLYGMTEKGGATSMGTLFKIKPDGTNYVRLLDFAGSSNGSSPKGSLISDGIFLYGMTSLGGSANYGTVFKILPDGTGYTKLHDFTSTPTGVSPQGDLYYDGTFLYGMTSFGGANSRGTFFKIMPDGSNYTKLSDFGAPFDGNKPLGSLYFDGTFFYATTNRGGSANMGTVFKIKPDGSALTKLVDFGVGSNGRYPEGSFSSDGTYLYGTTSEGGTNNYGSLFKVKPDGSGYATLLNFDNALYGSGPEGTPLLVGQFLYALTFVGGPNFEGTIFKIKTDGTNFKKVYEFSSVASGSYPEANSLIIVGSDFYGMVANGGLNQGGTMFRLKDVPENTTLFDFDGTSTGGVPTYTKLTCDGTTLYGMTSRGGTNDTGVVFKVSSDGTSFAKLHDFGLSPDGDRPYGSVYKDGTVLYGMTIRGGTAGDGTIFKLNTDGTGYAKIFNLSGATTGTDPVGGLISDGTYLYGITSQGGANGRGTVFRILPDGTGFAKLHDFASNSGFSSGDLLRIGTALYGMTFYGGTNNEGTIFKIETNGTGFTTIHEFGYPDGIYTYSGALVYDGTFLYGVTELGGTADDGIIFKIKPDGTGYLNLHEFQRPGAAIPLGALELVGTSLYGLSYEGGAGDIGALFKINVDGTGYETLMDFDGVTTGYEVLGTLCHCAGALYGMTTSGGANDYGTIFKYVLPTVTPTIPTITSFAPASGPVGTTVTITGTDFSSTVAGNTVYFGEMKATVTAATTTELTVTVPPGATYAPIIVLVNSLTAYSDRPFVVTFSGGGAINTCSFDPKIDFTTGSGPFFVTVGDFDADGKQDLVVTNYSSNTISVFRNTSSGLGNISFAAKVDFATGTSPLSVSVGDLDGDGKNDIVVSNSGLGTALSVFRNTSTGPGNINFATRVNFTTGPNPNFVSIGDLDKDGKPDLAVVNFSNATLSLFHNTSTGAGNINFDPKLDISTPGQPNMVAIGDLDGDHNADLAVVTFGAVAVSVFRNTNTVPGTMSFAGRVDFATGITPRLVSIGDLDGDDKPDMTVANDGSDAISVFRNSSTGPGNISFSAQPDLITGSGPRTVSIADLDGDGKADLAVTNQNDNSISAFRNTGTAPGSITYAPKVDFTTGARPFAVSIADLDNDGRSDMVATNFNSASISALRNIISVPTLTSFTPGAAVSGASVTITGTNFHITPANNVVKFNGTLAVVTASTSTSISTSVPAGATTGPITVMVGCNTATSATNFTVPVPTGIVSVTVNGTNQPDGSGVTYSSVLIGDNEVKNFVIKNSGTVALSMSDIQVNGDFAIAGAVPTSIAAGADDVVSIRFSPTVAGTITGKVTILSDGDIPVYEVNLSGVGITPTRIIGVTQASVILGNNSNLDFSATNVGSDVLKDLLITNSGNSLLTITNIQTTGDFTLTTAIPTSIGPGLNATVTVRFTPTVPGSRAGTFTISSNGDVSPYVVNLSGTGVDPTPVIVITEGGVTLGNGSNLDFSSIGVGADVLKNLLITNSGNTTLLISNLQVTGDFALASAAPSSIGPGLKATVTIRFTPTASGQRAGVLTMTSNGNIPTYSINLSGTGIEPVPVIEITADGSARPNGSELVFSSTLLDEEQVKDLVISNTGNATLNISDIQLTGDFALDSQAPSSIAPGLDATISIRFTPTAAGERTGALTISNNSDVPEFLINLSGLGSVPSPVIEVIAGGIGQGNGSDLDFSSTDIGSEELKDIVITNSGNAPLVITDIQVTGDFSLESAIPSFIGAQSDATITLRFAPTALGARIGTLTILSNGNTPVFVINLRGEGGTEIEVYNVVTTSQNGKHDFLKIKNITFFPDNTVVIFDRWGNKVFETKRYDNVDRVFKGSNDKGRDLPEGTYYYVIDKKNGDEPFTGFIFLRR
jgi:gliding motility-associated-like protein